MSEKIIALSVKWIKMRPDKEMAMGYNEFMAKVRHLDNRSAKWIMRHFYILFFEFFLVFVFVIFFINLIQVINISNDVSKENVVSRLLLSQSINTLMIVLLLLLNSFWILYIFNSIIRFRPLLQEINFNLSKRTWASSPPKDSGGTHWSVGPSSSLFPHNRQSYIL